MTLYSDISALKIPSREKLEVQMHDDSEEKNLTYIITSLASIKGDAVTKNFRLYKVSDNQTLLLIEKRDGSPEFEALKEG